MPRTPQLAKFNISVHFLTAKMFGNKPYFREPICVRIFCEELEAPRRRYGFHVLAFVVMPDHVHFLLWWDTYARPELAISRIVWAVKGKGARRIVDHLKSGDWVGEGNAFVYPHPVLSPAREPLDRPYYRNWRYKIWQQGTGYDFNIYAGHKLRGEDQLPTCQSCPRRVGEYTRTVPMVQRG